MKHPQLKGYKIHYFHIGRPIDSLLAATALHHELRLVTRNARVFDYPGLEVINPFG